MDKYAKAVMGGLTSGLGALGTALADGQVTAVEWVLVAAALVAGLGFVWGVPNAKPQLPVSGE
jgi:hypothetical protein